ncbi:TPA: hypothetical protein K4452_002615 [Enterococcus faecalis]|uniref:hypothetical protein n=1 Tax=Enterococcus faecalis TaxID=1351 RepID=UPI001CACD43D|nr:hypothetical protein [Enterococcus faecalis]HBI3769204.1 hypothetical protein [Enterococcus faecalis]
MKKLIGHSVMCIGFVGVGLFLSTESASAAEWYNPNIECQKGYPYGPTNLKNGKCRVNWNGVVDSVITGSMDSALHGFTGH